MPNITVIADTSCLIALSKIEAIELLKNYTKKFILQKKLPLNLVRVSLNGLELKTLKT
jgi:predicted nucleic acid-binding protein